jgi:hypothetical protein
MTPSQWDLKGLWEGAWIAESSSSKGDLSPQLWAQQPRRRLRLWTGGCRPSALAVQDEVTPQLLDLGRQTDGSSFRSRLRVRENDAGWRPQLIEGESLIEEAVLSKIKVLGGIG